MWGLCQTQTGRHCGGSGRWVLQYMQGQGQGQVLTAGAEIGVPGNENRDRCVLIGCRQVDLLCDCLTYCFLHEFCS